MREWKRTRLSEYEEWEGDEGRRKGISPHQKRILCVLKVCTIVPGKCYIFHSGGNIFRGIQDEGFVSTTNYRGVKWLKIQFAVRMIQSVRWMPGEKWVFNGTTSHTSWRCTISTVRKDSWPSRDKKRTRMDRKKGELNAILIFVWFHKKDVLIVEVVFVNGIMINLNIINHAVAWGVLLCYFIALLALARMFQWQKN